MFSNPRLRLRLSTAQSVSRSAQRRWASSRGAPRANDRFSLLVNGTVSKQDVLDRIASGASKAKPTAQNDSSDNALAILLSRELSSWLDDAAFMSALLPALLQRLGSSTSSQDPHLHVLAAAVDNLCPLVPYGGTSGGLSVVGGELDTLLPGLWDTQPGPDGGLGLAGSDAPQPSVSMRLNPFLGDFRPVDVTLPLANTVFQNGRPFTLQASRWSRDGPRPISLAGAGTKTTQRIMPSRDSIQAQADAAVRLFPVTTPRRIVAGLGNIVRQVQADYAAAEHGGAQPASEELEVNIHALINARSRHSPDHAPTTIRTWALIVPEKSASLDFLSGLTVAVDGPASVESEHERAETFARHFSKILAAGGRLHRVLSGGGGWGLKKGLLSLDPQTTYSSHGAQDLESFMASFGGEHNPHEVVSPGAYVQFFVEPMPQVSSSLHGVTPLPSLLLGTAPDGDIDYFAKDSPSSTRPVPSMELVEGHFGALSSQGFYISMTPESEAAEMHNTSTTHTKVDSSHSYIWEGSSRWL